MRISSIWWKHGAEDQNQGLMTHQYCKILITDVYIERFFELKEAVSKFTIEVNEPQTH